MVVVVGLVVFLVVWGDACLCHVVGELLCSLSHLSLPWWWFRLPHLVSGVVGVLNDLAWGEWVDWSWFYDLEVVDDDGFDVLFVVGEVLGCCHGPTCSHKFEGFWSFEGCD